MKRKQFLQSVLGFASLLAVPFRAQASTVPSATAPSQPEAGSPPQHTNEATLYEVYVAGVQHHDWWCGSESETLSPGMMLTARREPENIFDRWAVALYSPAGTKLGYLPHWVVHIPSNLMDAGYEVRYRIVKFNAHESQAPWHLVKVAILFANKQLTNVEAEKKVAHTSAAPNSAATHVPHAPERVYVREPSATQRRVLKPVRRVHETPRDRCADTTRLRNIDGQRGDGPQENGLRGDRPPGNAQRGERPQGNAQRGDQPKGNGHHEDRPHGNFQQTEVVNDVDTGQMPASQEARCLELDILMERGLDQEHL